jgi:acetyl esterase/lipase
MHTSTAPVRRWRAIRRGASVAILALLLGACGTTLGAPAMPVATPGATTLSAAASADESLLSGVVTNVPFVRPTGCDAAACSVLLDIYVPAGTGPFPSVVLVRGGPTGAGGRGYLDAFASELAESGLIVFNADMRDIASKGGGYPEAFDDVACAVRFARTWSFAYGGNGASVTLVGHSRGGFVGSVVALDPNEFTGDCLAGGSGRPNAFVGLSGNYNLDDPRVANDLQVFFGGMPAVTSEARAASNPFNYATGSQIPVYLIAGTNDTTVNPAAAEALDSYLTDQRWNVNLTLIPGATHNSIIVPSAAGPDSLAAILEATASAAG